MLKSPRCPTTRKRPSQKADVNNEYAVVKDLVICHAREMCIRIDAATEPVNALCGVESHQCMCETLIDSIQIIDKRLS
jgi:hypothetical protein